MKVLITGASGFIGSSLMRKLAVTEWESIPLVRRSAGFKNEVVIDFCDSNFCKTIRSLPKVDAIVHLGAKVGWDDSSKQELFVPNVLATANLLDWALKIRAYFVFASAAIVCGAKNTFITSKSKPDLDTDYGYSKWLAEEIIRMSGVRHIILRIAGVFGKGGPHHLNLNKSIDNALKGTVPVQYGDGEIKRNYIYVKDMANVIAYCLENSIEGTHLVAGSVVNTISEMLKIICNVLIPDSEPEYKNGNNGQDQIVEHSDCLPKGRLFEEALKDIGEK